MMKLKHRQGQGPDLGIEPRTCINVTVLTKILRSDCGYNFNFGMFPCTYCKIINAALVQ